MTDTTAAYYGSNAIDVRGLGFGGCRRALRCVGGNVAMGLGAVTAVGLIGVTATLAAAWMVHLTLASNPELAFKSRTGPGTLALIQSDLTPRAPQGSRDYASRTWPPRALDISAEIARDGRTQVAKLTPVPSRVHPQPKVERIASIPLPRPNPGRMEMALKAAEPVVPKPAPQIARAVVPPAAVQVSPPTNPQVAAKAIAKLPPPAPAQVAAATLPLPPLPPEVPAVKRVLPQLAHNKAPAMPEIDSRTAVYDISARTVYLPNGKKLEAHSGYGDKLDDPRYVNVRMRGATPPNIYDLTLREQLFHGVRAIRLNPVDESKMHGRDGILAHTYMLGPNGDSNGCVSFKDYDKFLQAFLDGQVNRLVVVPELGNTSWRTALVGRVERYADNSPPAARNMNAR